jgi:hypothetical protein
MGYALAAVVNLCLLAVGAWLTCTHLASQSRSFGVALIFINLASLLAVLGLFGREAT